jgi:hypothetical protein
MKVTLHSAEREPTMSVLCQNLHLDSLRTPIPYPNFQTSLYRSVGIHAGEFSQPLSNVNLSKIFKVLGNSSLYVQHPPMHPRFLLLEQGTARPLRPQRFDRNRPDQRCSFLRWRSRHPRTSNPHDLDTANQLQKEISFECHILYWRLRVFDEHLQICSAGAYQC